MRDLNDLPKVYFFIHIPKNGGSSVRHFLRQHFGPEAAYSELSLLNHVFHQKKDCEHLAYKHTHWMKSFSSHKLNLDCLDGIVNSIPFATIRNPVERFISRYFFFRENGPAYCAAKDMTLDQFVEYELVKKKCQPHTNSQVNHLSNGKGLTWLEEAIERNNCKLFSNLSLIPEWLGSGVKMPVTNKSNKDDVSQFTKDRISELSKEDIYFFEKYKNK